MGFFSGSDGKESACKAGDAGSVPGLGDPLEEGMATHSSIPPWSIPWPEEPTVHVAHGQWATVHGVAESDPSEQLSTTQHSQSL